MEPAQSNRSGRLWVAALAAFCTYFCMYAFRKPFTASEFAGSEVYGLNLKAALVIAQLAGYMLSKFIGIKVIAEMRSEFRAAAIVGLIIAAELALVGFAYVPVPWKVVMLFLNGLPLGMIFGLVLGYLEGRQQTEALSAALCASFIISSGVVKSVGSWLMVDPSWQLSEYQMPMVAGALFFPPLLVSVWLLQRTPPPDDADRKLRNERNTMSRVDRNRFVRAYLPGLALLVFVYVALTVIRTVRDDFGVEIWRAMGVTNTPSVFATAETIVGIFVTALNAIAIWIRHNLTAMKATVVMMSAGFAVVAASALAQSAGMASPMVFMVACGVGMYVPYVAFHTTLFERLLAASRHPGNLGFLMYLADAIGYLGYALVLAFRSTVESPAESILAFFNAALLVVSVLSIAALLTALGYFHRVLTRDAVADVPAVAGLAVEEVAAE